MTMRNIFCAVFGAAGSIFASIFGGWDAAIVTLIIFMSIDYITGLIVAGVFHASKKSPNGSLESRADGRDFAERALPCLSY